jgi:hypothetical protein
MLRAGSTGKTSLIRKMAEVMAEVDRVPKTGRNAFHGYDYATESDIVDAVRQGLAQRAVMMIPTIAQTEWRDMPQRQGGTQRLCTLTVRFTFLDGDSGEELSFEVLGEGQDIGDKATYKAFTGATKYALLKTFLIPTGDDPETERDEPSPRGSERSSQKRQEQPAKGGKDRASSSTVPATSKPREAASAGANMPTLVGFGPHKGKAIGALTDDELAATIDKGHEMLTGDPEAKWATALRANMVKLEAEAERRCRPAESTEARRSPPERTTRNSDRGPSAPAESREPGQDG